MNKFFYILCLFAVSMIFPQNAQDYFPQQPGFKWNYVNFPLDSLGNPMESQSYYQIDTFTVAANYEGKLSNIVLSKTGTPGIIGAMPYLDSSFYSFSNSIAGVYQKMLLPDSSLGILDSTLLGNFKRYEGWYDVFKFAQPVNQQYTIFSLDTNITFDTLSLPLRLEFKAKRVTDQTLTTEVGSFNCKKFVTYKRLSYLIGIPPFILPVKIVEFVDTSYFAPNYWLVKNVTPTTSIDLSILGYGVYYINGSNKDIILSVPLSVGEKKEILNSFTLEQNFPNPFNPSTKIKFSLASGGNTVLKVMDILGREKVCLTNKYLSQGNYSITVDASNWASGVYIYSLEINGSRTAKKMVLQK